jgi:DnaJ domain
MVYNSDHRITGDVTDMTDMIDRIANPYETLGVPRTASAAQVREAYRRLAKQFHPDLHPDARTTERMQRINSAWELLSSPADRARYDANSAMPSAMAYPHWGAASRRSYPQYGPEATWARGRAYTAARAMRDDDPGPLRWGLLVLVAVPVAVLLTALFGGIVPLPILGILLFLIARAVFGRGD